MDITCAWIGRVTSAWEDVEVALADIYTILIGQKLGDARAQQKYGADRIFIERLARLRQAADTYFVQHPDQKLEGEFREITRAAEGFSGRRNDVAHATVRPLNWYVTLNSPTTPNAPFQFAAIPPRYDQRKFKIGMPPDFIYTSAEMRVIESGLYSLQVQAIKWRDQAAGARPLKAM